MEKKGLLDRRTFLRCTCASAATLAIPWYPGQALAQTTYRLSWTTIFKMHAVRFIGGLVWDMAKPVLIKAASNAFDWVMDQGTSRSWKRSYASASALQLYSSPPVEERLVPREYRASIVVYGISGYELLPKKNDFRLKLRTDDEIRRVSILREYMADTGIRICSMYDKPEEGARSYRVTSRTSLDDLLSVEYMDMPTGTLESHYKTMEEITGATVFKTWHA